MKITTWQWILKWRYNAIMTQIFDLPCIIGAATHWEMEDYGKQVSKYHS